MTFAELPKAVRTAIIFLLAVIATAITFGLAILVTRLVPFLLTKAHLPSWLLIGAAVALIAVLLIVRMRSRRRRPRRQAEPKQELDHLVDRRDDDVSKQ